jgi:hypothetical protein
MNPAGARRTRVISASSLALFKLNLSQRFELYPLDLWIVGLDCIRIEQSHVAADEPGPGKQR